MNLAKSFFILAATMFAHWLWTTRFSFWGLTPQFPLIMTVLATARYGRIRAMVLGFLWGLFLDALTVHVFGANALALTLISYGTGAVRRQVDLTGLLPQSVAMIVMTGVYFLILAALGLVFAKTLLWIGWVSFFLSPLYNVLIAAMLLPILPREER